MGSASNVVFLFIQTQFMFYVPLGSTVALTASICLEYILDNFEHARGQDRRQAAAAKPRRYTI